jgi:hypothetical protein
VPRILIPGTEHFERQEVSGTSWAKRDKPAVASVCQVIRKRGGRPLRRSALVPRTCRFNIGDERAREKTVRP